MTGTATIPRSPTNGMFTTGVVSEIPPAKLLHLSYLVTYAKHFSTVHDERMPLLSFVVVATGVLLAIIAFGAWRLRQLDV